MNLLKRLILLVVVMAALIAGFYWFMQQQAEKRSADPVIQSELKGQPSKMTTLEGVISFVDKRYFLESQDKTLTEIDSLQLTFQPYIGNRVKVTGQFSGETLMVSKIEVID